MEARANAVAEMETLAQLEELNVEQEARFDALEAEIDDLDKRSARAATAATLRASQPAAPASDDAAIRSVAKAPSTPGDKPAEVRAVSPYAADNRNVSWFSDRATLANPESSNSDVDEARSRLAAHYDAAGDEGAGRQVRTYSSTTTTEGGHLAAPQYLQDAFADLLSAGRVTADLVGKMALPQAGKTFYIPTQDGATAVAVHTENAALTETTATFSQIQIDACRVGGTATMPNWLVDRSFPGADQIVLRDLAKTYAVKVNDIVLNSSTSNRKGLLQETGLGGATATAATAAITDVYPALANAVADVVAGYAGYPDAMVMHPRRWAWFLGQASTSHPVINPNPAAQAFGSFSPEGKLGQFQGPVPVGTLLGVPVYLDPTIPVNLGAGTDEDRIIVMKRDEPILMETAPKFAISYEAQFAKDQFVARVTGDVAFTCARRKGAVSIVSGTALNDTV